MDSKEAMKKAKLLERYKNGILTSEPVRPEPVMLSKDQEPSPIMLSKDIQPEPIMLSRDIKPAPSASAIDPSAAEILQAIRAKDSGYVPHPTAMEPASNPVIESYSPVRNYLKKGKK